jgi:hypothetical protein
MHSLGTCLFFALMCVATLGVRRPASARGVLHTRCFALMLPAWAGLVALSFLPSNGVLESYFQAARAGGALFLLLQLVVILDFVYGTNEACLEADDGCSRAKLVGGALATNAATIAGAHARTPVHTHSTHASGISDTCVLSGCVVVPARCCRNVCVFGPFSARPGLHQRHAHPLRRIHRAVAAATGAPNIAMHACKGQCAEVCECLHPCRCLVVCSRAAP